MNCKKKCVLFTASTLGALIAFASASMAFCLLENNTDICYLMKKKAKKAIKGIEAKIDKKIDNKLDC